MARLLVIGGSDAGISASLRARELEPGTNVAMILADSFPNFSICGLPFFISGETPDWHSLAHRTLDEIERTGVEVVMERTATEIDPIGHSVTLVDPSQTESRMSYDRLVIATGAVPVRPPIEGLDLPGVHVLHTMEDSFGVHDPVAAGARSAIIIGAGYIGLEMADALTHRGLQVTVVEQLPSVMGTVDVSLGGVVREELERHGVTVCTDVAIKSVDADGDGLTASGSGGFSASADLVLVVVGVRPASELAAASGVNVGTKRAIEVSRKMETNLPEVYAAGDCVETWHRLLEKNTYLPLGTTAHKQGRVAGANAVGHAATFEGSLGTQVVKVFDLAVARTGLRDHEAQEAGLDPLTVETTAMDHKAYYPGAHELRIRITGDRSSGRLLGAQIVGNARGQVAKRIDIAAIALYSGMSVEDLSDLDLSYTPPFSSPWDPVQAAAQSWAAASSARTS